MCKTHGTLHSSLLFFSVLIIVSVNAQCASSVCFVAKNRL